MYERIHILQHNLPILRMVLGWSQEDLGALLDITRQTVWNLEHAEYGMTKVQYMAILYVLEQWYRLGQIDDDKMDYIEQVLLKQKMKIVTKRVKAED